MGSETGFDYLKGMKVGEVYQLLALYGKNSKRTSAYGGPICPER